MNPTKEEEEEEEIHQDDSDIMCYICGSQLKSILTNRRWCCGVATHSFCLESFEHENKKKMVQIRCGHKCVACNKKKSVLADSSGMYKIVMDWVEKKKLWAIEALAEAYDSKRFPLNFPYSPVKAREYSLIAARRGLVDSQYNLASMYAAGDGGEQVRYIVLLHL